MIVDPVEAFAQATGAAMASSTPVAPIPTVVPTPPVYEMATDTGKRALW